MGPIRPPVGVQFSPACRVRQQMGGDVELMHDLDGTGPGGRERDADASKDQGGFQQRAGVRVGVGAVDDDERCRP
jgi:hypothetical protein